MTDIAQGTTAGGERRPPRLVAELVERYAQAAQGFLPAELRNIGRLVDESRLAAASRQPDLDVRLRALDTVVRNWTWVARPIQLAATARGEEHRESRQVADDLRKLGIELFHEHGLLAPALRIMELLRRDFVAVPAIAERAGRDRIAIEALARERGPQPAR
jgi:hypothetical protein